jgi:hypothetical protein
MASITLSAISIALESEPAALNPSAGGFSLLTTLLELSCFFEQCKNSATIIVKINSCFI